MDVKAPKELRVWKVGTTPVPLLDRTVPTEEIFPGGYHPPVVERVRVPAIAVLFKKVTLSKLNVPAPAPAIAGLLEVWIVAFVILEFAVEDIVIAAPAIGTKLSL